MQFFRISTRFIAYKKLACHFSTLMSSETTEEAVTKTLMSNYTNFSEKKFIDKVNVKVKAGSGGCGCVSYYRDRVIRSGALDGGDGGNGEGLIL